MIDLRSIPSDAILKERLDRLWMVSGKKILVLAENFDATQGTAVYTVEGRYTARAWTEWTLGFQIGSALLHFDATGEQHFLELGRRQTVAHMAPHVTHFGVHDHGFTIISTYGVLLRLMTEGRIAEDPWQRRYYEMALRCSGAIQAHRWTNLADGDGYIYSFNGPHSLFADTIRSLRSLAAAYRLGGALQGESDERISLLDRLVRHARTTARHTVYYGDGRDGFDVRGRVAHESFFNVLTGEYRCPGTQQGYSPFSTWTRGLAWIMCGFAEQLEYLDTLQSDELEPYGGSGRVVDLFLHAARATCDFYLQYTPACGVPYWDTGAPGLKALGDYLQRPADPYNDHEPVDSSAAAIAAQALLRLGRYLDTHGQDGEQYRRAGLRTAHTLLSEPYLCSDADHQGLLLHSVYHWPRRWDYAPRGHPVACGESTMWGDYHLRELALYLQRTTNGEPPHAFYTVSA